MEFTVRSVRILGRWVPERLQAEAEQLAGLGQTFDPSRLNSAVELVRTELTKAETEFAIRLTGSTSVLYIDAEVCDVSNAEQSKQAQIVIRPYYLRIDLYNLGRNILPVPRTARPTFFTEVPSALLLMSPVVGFNNDRQYGPSVILQTKTDLLQLTRPKSNKASPPMRLDVELDARKSLNNPFHYVGANLEMTRPVYTDSSIGWNVGVRYAKQREPLVEGRYSQEFLRIGGALHGSTKSPLLRKYVLGASARFLQNEYSTDASAKLQNPENGYEVFTVSDGRVRKGFARLGIWFDAGVPRENNALRPYQRIATRLGYGVTIGSGHNNVDLETIAGTGYTWGSPPAYNQFFAGNTASNFLYQPISHVDSRIHPEGPMIRSLGEREGGLNTPGGITLGGTSYWHFNFNLSIPVSRWAKPLIPDIVISEEPRRLTLRSALKGQAATAKNFIIDDLINNHGFPDDEKTEVAADKIINKDIRPTLDYLAERANVYSVKPLLLFDIAGIKGEPSNKTWVAAGLGVQATIVVARLEAGYMQTLSPPSDSGKGNLFLRFILQNFY